MSAPHRCRRRLGALLALGMAATACQAPRSSLIALDPRFAAIVPDGARLERIADGFTWVEGPVWDADTDALYFSDIPSNTVYRWTEADGVSPYLSPSGYTGDEPFRGREPGSNGLLFDHDGRLVLCQHGDRRIARLEADGSFTPLAETFRGDRLNSPNDAILADNGDILFTDPPFGLPDVFDDPAREIAFSGVYRRRPNGRLELLTDRIRAPNGLALSPGGEILYVSNADRENPVVLAFDIEADGGLTNERVVFDATRWLRPDRGVPDGIEVDEAGHLFVAGPGGVHVITPDGVPIGLIDPGATTSNVAWGEDGGTLYITASDAVYRIRLLTRGAR